MSTDIIWTTLTSVLVLASNAIIAALLARRSVELFGQYNLARRIAATMLPLLSLGLTLGLAKFISAAKNESERSSHLIAAIGSSAAVVCLGTLALVVAPGPIANLAFGRGETALLWPTWAYCVGLLAMSLAYAAYRGRFQQGRANVTILIGQVILPLGLILLLPSNASAGTLVATVGLSVLAWGTGHLLYALIRGDWTHVSIRGLAADAVGLIGFSATRMVGGVAQGMVMTLGPLVAQRAGEGLTAGYLLGALGFAQLGAASLQAFSTVLLPRVSRMSTQGNVAGVSRLSGQFVHLLVVLCLAGIPVALVIAPRVVTLWLGPDFAPATLAVRVVLLSIPWYVSYSVLTSVTDGSMRSPVSTYGALAGLTVTAISSALVAASSAGALAACFLAGQIVAGGTILTAVFRGFSPRIAWVGLGVAGLAGGGTAVAAYMIGRVTSSSLVVIFVAVLGFTVASILGLAISPSEFGFQSRMRAVTRWRS